MISQEMSLVHYPVQCEQDDEQEAWFETCKKVINFHQNHIKMI